MKLTSLLFNILVILFSSSGAFASYFQADLPTNKANLSLGVHLIITGKGMEVGDQWLRAAHTQALLFKDRTIHGSIRIVGAIENSQSIGKLKTWGYQNIVVFEKTFTGDRLVEQIKQNQKIASIDFIGHNGALLGFALENYENRFFIDQAKALASISNRMSANSFVRIMGCNTGWNLAPVLSQSLKVPVAGTFTFADIEKVHESQDWYYNDEGRYPGGQFINRNVLSFNSPVDCISDGGCMRLKPVRINYQGKHGSYAGTVPFIKYFCGPLAESDCFRRMAISTVYEVSTVAVGKIPTQDQFAKIMADHFCPSYVNQQKKLDCQLAIENHVNGKKKLNPSFTTSDGPTINCGFQKCNIQKDCSSGSCVMVGISGDKPSTTFVDELNAFMKGYSSLLQ